MAFGEGGGTGKRENNCFKEIQEPNPEQKTKTTNNGIKMKRLSKYQCSACPTKVNILLYVLFCLF